MSTTITDYAGLVAIGDDLAGDYVFGNDIDASGESWTPLGTFTGTFNGRDYKITNLTITINDTGSQYGCLFLKNQGTIQNLGIEDCVISVTSTDRGARACALVNDNCGDISDCWSTGTISANCGGAVRWAEACGLVEVNNITGSLTRCHSSATCTAVSVGHASASGLIEDNWGDIDECYAEGNVSATSTSATRDAWAAGFCARNGYDAVGYEGIINNAYARGNASAVRNTGTAWAA